VFARSFRLPFRLLGIPIRIDASFLLVLPLLAWLIGSQLTSYGPLLAALGIDVDLERYRGGITPYLLGLTAAIGLFGSVLIHELGHALAARLYGVEVEEITLWFLGGLASFRSLPRAPGAEAVVAVAGPVTSMLLGIVAAIALRLELGPEPLLLVSAYLASANVFLALFNLLPALPLDGGRILRSLLALRMPQLRATRIAAAVSRVLAVLLGVAGFVSVNIVLLAVAFFVYGAVRSETRTAMLEEALGDRSVADLMTRDVVTVDPTMPLPQFAKLAFYQPHHGYPVTDSHHHLIGFARLASGAGDSVRADGTVGDIIEPIESIAADATAREALDRLGGDVGRLVVLDEGGVLIGIVSRSDLLRELQRYETNGAEPSAAGRAP
jgi:Zn-dependent protease